MSHGKLRDDQNCLNCGNLVEQKFCPNCGQENTETRKPFHYLFTHFIEDFTHYDGQFWGTIKNLLFKPGKLTETYIEGKRQRFVPPVKLYIFISFITFFLFALIPPFNIDFEAENTLTNLKNKKIFDKAEITATQKIIDSIKAQKNLEFADSVAIAKLSALVNDSASINFIPTIDLSDKMADDANIFGYTTRKSYDAATAKNPGSLDFIKTPVAHKFFELKEKGVKKKEIFRNLAEISFHNSPKALFLFLPIFAFFMWIFHNKKKWWYFDHGVFTLHYFSFLLLNILLFSFLYKASGYIAVAFIHTILRIAMTVVCIYCILYFFIAHRRVYHAHGMVSFIIGSILFTINFVTFIFLAFCLGIVSFLMIH